jgi:hypothetical protein
MKLTIALLGAFCWFAVFTLWLGVIYVHGILPRLRQALVAAVVTVLALALTLLATVFQLFTAFAGETLVARVTTEKVAAGEFELTYAPEAPAEPRQARLRGDQWGVSGGVIKWRPWVTALGVRSYHKPMRLYGQFADSSRQQQPPSIHPLEAGADQFWEALYWAHEYIPLIESVYGSSAYVYVEPGETQEIYVTHSGYMIKKVAPKGRITVR